MPTDFKSAFERMQSVLATNPQAGHAQFSAATHQVTGLRSQAKIRQFDITVDEPPALAGTDLGPNPVELVLAAFGACQEITYRLYAEKMGIPLNAVSVSIKGNIDLRGFFDVDDRARPGFDSVEASVTLDSPASPEELARLTAAVERHCPVLDIISNSTPVKVNIDYVNAVQAAVA